MATFTNFAGSAQDFEILNATFALQNGVETTRPLGVSKVVARPGTNRGVGGEIEVLAETWWDARWLLDCFSRPFTLTETPLGISWWQLAPVGEPRASALPLAGHPAFWQVRIEVTDV